MSNQSGHEIKLNDENSDTAQENDFKSLRLLTEFIWLTWPAKVSKICTP